MKLIPENIKQICGKNVFSLIALFVCFQSAIGQAPAPDTTISPTITEDTARLMEQVDTNAGGVAYFDPVTSGGTADSMHLREVPARVVDSVKRDDAFWYANRAFHARKEEEKENNHVPQTRRWMNMTTLVIIVAVFIALLLTYLFQNNIIRRRAASITGEENAGLSEENIFEINYQREIDRAVTATNYRLAIRLMFLRLLKKLSQENIIQYKQERTNSEYLMQLTSTSYYADFFRLTRDFEYTWYGKFDVSADAYRIIQNDFEKFDQRLS